MKVVWIIGVGRFGSNALNRLSTHHKECQFILVDNTLENLYKAEGANITPVHSDGIGFLTDNLKPGVNVSWIIPTLPVHMAWEWCRSKMGSDRLVQSELFSDIDPLLPNPMHGENGDLYVSHASFICPANCCEPDAFCTVTRQLRKQDMYRILEMLHHKDYASIVLRSRQVGPGVGGVRPEQLFAFFKKIEEHKGPLLICTACRCHGVITGAVRL